MNFPSKIDLHMHSTVSDGTDTPEEILKKVKEAGIGLFSLTDHDAIKGALAIRTLLKEDDPRFICGAEFSCRDGKGKYHILGYHYDPEHPSIRGLVDLGHQYRMNKVTQRLDFLKNAFGFTFKEEDLKEILSMDNPGKPHIANMMVRYGYADTKEIAIKQFINLIRFPEEYVRPEEAIRAILESGGIPVLAHPIYGSGDQLILGDEMDERLRYLMDMGLKGIEAYYSQFTDKMIGQMLEFAQKYQLYVTAGSDYHGKNKLIALGDNNLEEGMELPEGLKRFLEDTL